MNRTKIETTDYTWNPVTGCRRGCSYCYARRIAHRFPRAFGGDFEPRFWEERLLEPAGLRKPSKIFVCSMADLFAPWVPDEWIEDILAVASANDRHTFQFLTKYPGRLAQVVLLWPENCWVGATAESLTDAEAIMWDHLVLFESAVRYISLEPLLEGGLEDIDLGPLDWLIVGAMTGPGAIRPERAWVEQAIQAADEVGAAVFLKGSILRLYPDLLRRREFPIRVNGGN